MQSARAQFAPSGVRRDRWQRRAGALLAIGGALLIGSLTLFPHPDQVREVARTPLYCVLCGNYFGIDFLLNVALFAPLGAGLRLCGVRPWRAQLGATLASLAIETVQGLALPGRDPALGDVISNSLGAALGFVLAGWGAPLLLPRPRASRALAALAAALWLALWSATGLLVQPSLPSGRWFAQAPPEGVYSEDFQGELRTATLGERPLRSGELAPSEPLREALLHTGVELGASARLGPAPRALAGLVSLFDERQRELAVLGQWGRDLVFRVRTRSAAYGLRTPGLRLAVPAGAGAELEARGTLRGGELRLVASDAGRSREATLGLSPSWGWSLLLPFEYAFGPEERALSALWLAATLLPFAYYARRAHEPRAGRAAGGAAALAALLGGVAAAGLVGVPALLALRSSPMAEWLGAAAGLGTGWWLAWQTLRLERRWAAPRRSDPEVPGA